MTTTTEKTLSGVKGYAGQLSQIPPVAMPGSRLLTSVLSPSYDYADAYNAIYPSLCDYFCTVGDLFL